MIGWSLRTSQTRTALRPYSQALLSARYAIAITVLCLYLIGDGLRDALDPRLRGAK